MVDATSTVCIKRHQAIEFASVHVGGRSCLTVRLPTVSTRGCLPTSCLPADILPACQHRLTLVSGYLRANSTYVYSIRRHSHHTSPATTAHYLIPTVLYTLLWRTACPLQPTVPSRTPTQRPSIAYDVADVTFPQPKSIRVLCTVLLGPKESHRCCCC